MNGAYGMNWYDAAAVADAPTGRNIDNRSLRGQGRRRKIKDAAGNYLQLSDLISKALAEPNSLFPGTPRRLCPDYGTWGICPHTAVFTAQRPMSMLRNPDAVSVIEEFLHHANLLYCSSTTRCT
jgi:hypothetical protein